MRAFLDRLRAFRVLDPACGSGNFLYLSLTALKDLELQVSVEAEALGLQREFPQVGPEAVLGIEVNPYAAELARVSVWIGHIQWARRHGLPPPSDPVLRPLETIECRDAVLTPDGKPAQWPKADAIIGNPPFLGDKAMIGTLSEAYTATLRKAYENRVPGGADLVTYWFEKAREAVMAGATDRVGLVATQSIRKGTSRRVLDAIARDATIYEAWSDEPWTVDGADVRVSLASFTRQPVAESRLNGAPVTAIHADLSSGTADLTTAHRLSQNLMCCFQGPVKVGQFEVEGTVAREWLAAPINPNGRPNADVVRPWVNGRDIAQRPSDTWIVDFADLPESTAAYYISPFQWVYEHVKPFRDTNRRSSRKERWWLHGETVPGLRLAIAGKARFIATPRVAKHRLFVWCHSRTLPDSRVFAIARADDATIGILHSRFHQVWSLRLASRHGVGNDPTYNSQTCFETFPFPDGLTPDLPPPDESTNGAAHAIANAARALVEARDRWLNPPELVTRVPEIVPGYPDRLVPKDPKAAVTLQARTLTSLYNLRGTPGGAWLDNLHRALDEAVATAYGWPADLPDDELLSCLLALNHARSAEQASGET